MPGSAVEILGRGRSWDEAQSGTKHILGRCGFLRGPGEDGLVTVPWDESTRPTNGLPGAERVRGGAGQHLRDVHHHYRGELDRLHDVLGQVREGSLSAGAARSEVNDMALRANTWVLGSVCQSYCFSLTQHHTLESDLMFPHLARQDGELAPVVARLGEEHLAIHYLLEAVDAALVALVSRPGDLGTDVGGTDFGGIDVAVELLSSALLSHFAYEEQELAAALDRFGMG